MSRVTYPTDAYGTAAQFTYSFDAMMRPLGMTDQNSAPVVSNVSYGVANELLAMTYNGGTETRTYDPFFQLTNISGLGQNITYAFPAPGANAGKIVSQKDMISGEMVTYAYDSLNRLTSATASAWSQTYTYDGFGNLTNRQGTGTAQSTTISTPAILATNQLSGYTYDLNGNQISTGYAYDFENRMVQANAGAVQYGYDGKNKRIWQGNFINQSNDWLLTSDSISLFGIDGKLIGTYWAGAAWNNSQTQIPLSFYSATQRVYFGRKLVATLDSSGVQRGVVQDRLESVGKYYPFGEERNSPPMANDQVKFASYTRDSATGLDYADQRYYASTFGRFLTADPSTASGGASDPVSWNRYTYTRADPTNRYDSSGLQDEGPPKTPAFTYCPDGSVVFWVSGNPLADCPKSDGQSKSIGVILSEAWGQRINDGERDTVNQTIAQVREILLKNPLCAGLFNAAGAALYGGSAVAMLDAYRDNNLITSGMFYVDGNRNAYPFPSGSTGAITSPGTAALPGPGGIKVTASTIVIQSPFGFFFTGFVGGANGVVMVNQLQGQGFEGLSLDQMRDAVIIHELLHAAGAIPEDSGPDVLKGASQANSELVRTSCFN